MKIPGLEIKPVFAAHCRAQGLRKDAPADSVASIGQLMESPVMRSLWIIVLLLSAGIVRVQSAGTSHPRAVFLIGEDEYKTWESLPQFAKENLDWRGWRISIIQQDAQDKHRFPGFIEAMRDADLLFVSTRRRALPQEQLDAIRAHLNAGKPLVGIRTASHGFSPRGADATKGAAWPTFDPEVLGGNYNNHHGAGPKTIIRTAPGEDKNPLITGVKLDGFTSNASLYKVSPLKSTAKPLLIGTIPGQPAEPVAWTHTYGEKQARVFYTSLGHPDDFANPAFRRLLLNGMLWATNQPIPPADAPLARP